MQNLVKLPPGRFTWVEIGEKTYNKDFPFCVKAGTSQGTFVLGYFKTRKEATDHQELALNNGLDANETIVKAKTKAPSISPKVETRGRPKGSPNKAPKGNKPKPKGKQTKGPKVEVIEEAVALAE